MKALFTAIKKRDTEKITEIITKKPELVNCTAKKPPKQDDGQSPLQLAFKTRNFWAVNYFLEKGADLNSVDSYGNTALMRLCADIKNRWFDRERPLAKESVEDLKQIFDLLIKYGADINQSTPTREPITKMQRNLLEQLGIL